MAEPTLHEPDPEEEATVRRLQAQNEAFAELDRQSRPRTVPGPVTVAVHGEWFVVPLTVKDVRTALPDELRAEFEAEIDAAPPNMVGRLIRKWALEVIPGDAIDRVDVLLRAEQQAAGIGTAAAPRPPAPTNDGSTGRNPY
ncbi:hypothetical protein QR77_41565 [Streptomyces sp. 150FB]|uniref:hypothetical protein n=1 Tax=Streptomyces sp. 150FB TaxID=1576605 RepID=UPI000589343E|nr:hypothetical protein [Streptomyces sp. 150FB]KIF72764.1 hypothetical protein QR77_41565 [Streptomyces sp. 150FB]